MPRSASLPPAQLRRSTSAARLAEDLPAIDGEEEALDFSDELAELLDDGGPEEDAAEPVAERKAATAELQLKAQQARAEGELQLQRLQTQLARERVGRAAPPHA